MISWVVFASNLVVSSSVPSGQCQARCGTQVGFISPGSPDVFISYNGTYLDVPFTCSELTCSEIRDELDSANAKIADLQAAVADLQAAVHLIQNPPTNSPTVSPTQSPTPEFMPCTCDDIRRASMPSGHYDLTCTSLGLSYTTYCDNDNDGGGWTLVSRIDKDSRTHEEPGAVHAQQGHAPESERACSDHLTSQPKGAGLSSYGSPRPSVCGSTWKLSDADINALAQLGSSPIFKLDCGMRQGFYQSQFTLDGSGSPWSSSSESNRERYKRQLSDSWSGWIDGSNSYGYHYGGYDDDAWEESIGWSAYAVHDQHAGSYSPLTGCLAPTSTSYKVPTGGHDGYLWLRLEEFPHSPTPLPTPPTPPPPPTPMSPYCTCYDVRQDNAPSGIYHFDCASNGLSYTTYCDNDTDDGGWTLVSRIAYDSHEHEVPGAVNIDTPPDSQRECVSLGAPNELPGRPKGFGISEYGTNRPDICGNPWKLSDADINTLALMGPNSVFRLDCGMRSGYYQSEYTVTGTGQQWTAAGETNRERYKRYPSDSWSGWIDGSNSYGYNYGGFDDDAWEEQIGWSAYAVHAAHAGWAGPMTGCLAPKSGLSSYQPKGGHDGYLWLRVENSN